MNVKIVLFSFLCFSHALLSSLVLELCNCEISLACMWCCYVPPMYSFVVLGLKIYSKVMICCLLQTFSCCC
jgi:hypothetical protein